MRKGNKFMIPGICFGISLMLIACHTETSIPETTAVTASTEAASTKAPTEAAPEASPEPSDEQKKALQDKLTTEAGGDIVQFVCLDYNHDGSYEAYAIIGSKDEYLKDTYNGALWFISDSQVTQIGDHTSYSYLERLSIGAGYLVSVNKLSDSGSMTFIYGVKDGQPYQDPISGELIGLQQLEDQSFTAIHDTYDACTDDTGHTWKKYWFYWDDGFHEFGGLEITLNQFKELSGADQALAQIEKEKGQISNILYRDNHIININYLTPWERDGEADYINQNFLNLKYKDGAVTILNSGDNRGVYQKALNPDIAVYPKK